MPGPIIVFDLDGTLVDTAPDLLDTLNACLTDAGYLATDPANLRGLVGYGARVMITRALSAQGQSPSDDELDDLFEAFLRHYADNIPGRSLPYPGAVEAIDRFAAHGYLFAICTNKYQSLSEALLQGLGLHNRFAAICGADRFSVRKPDPGHLMETIAAAGGDEASAVMIGDSRTDIDTAKAAGIPVVAVDWGYTAVPVEELGPDAIISHFDDLTLDLAGGLIGSRA